CKNRISGRTTPRHSSTPGSTWDKRWMVWRPARRQTGMRNSVRTAWKRSLRRDKACKPHAAQLARLEMFPHGDGECEGIPAESLLAAVTHYVEASLPSLAGSPDQALALLRWAARRQFEIAASCTRKALAQSRELSTRLADTYEKERRRLAHDL